MKMVIEIPKEVKAVIDRKGTNETVAETLWQAVKNGTPLPEGHGRLIDADALLKEHKFFDAYPFPSTAIDNAPTIIEADKESEVVGKIHCTFTDTEIAKSFIEDVDAVKELLPQAESEDEG